MFIISDNFYQDPHDVRKVALSWDFCVQGNYPGMRTASCTGTYRDSIKASFEKIIGEKITYALKLLTIRKNYLLTILISSHAARL